METGSVNSGGLPFGNDVAHYIRRKFASGRASGPSYVFFHTFSRPTFAGSSLGPTPGAMSVISNTKLSAEHLRIPVWLSKSAVGRKRVFSMTLLSNLSSASVQHNGKGDERAKKTQFANIIDMINNSNHALCTNFMQNRRKGFVSFKNPHDTLLYFGSKPIEV